MTLHISEICWDTEGESRAECNLPDEIIVLDAPDRWQDSSYQEMLMAEVEETFGFAHDGYRLVKLDVDRRKRFKCDGTVEVMKAP